MFKSFILLRKKYMDEFVEWRGRKYRVLGKRPNGTTLLTELQDAVFEDIPETDFSNGVRGKYVERYKEYLKKRVLGQTVDVKV